MNSFMLPSCPFCGGEAILMHGDYEWSVYKQKNWVTCKECGAQGSVEETADLAVKAWGTRK